MAVSLTSKVCTGCDTEKPLSDFTKNKNAKDGLNHRCRTCCSSAFAKWRSENIEVAKKVSKESRQRMSPAARERKRESDRADYYRHHAERREAQIESRLKSRYGITQADYDRMLEEQDGKCALCGTTDPKHRGDRFCVDHDHETLEVRGLLCGPCNRRLGFLEDAEWVERALRYMGRKQ